MVIEMKKREEIAAEAAERKEAIVVDATEENEKIHEYFNSKNRRKQRCQSYKELKDLLCPN